MLRRAENFGAELPDRFRHELAALLLELEEQAAGVVAAGQENFPALQNQRRRHGGDADFPRVGFPQQRAVLGGNAGHAAAAAIDIKPPPGEFHRHDGGMRHLPVVRIGRAPERLSGSKVHGGEQGIVAAGRQNDGVCRQ